MTEVVKCHGEEVIRRILHPAKNMALGTIMVHGVPRYSDPVMATGWVGLQCVSTTLGNNHCLTLGKVSGQSGHVRAPLRLLASFRRPFSKMRQSRLLSVADSNQIMTSASDATNEIAEQSFPDNPSSTAKPSVLLTSAAEKIQPEASDSETNPTRIKETANESKPVSEAKQQTVSSSTGPMPKRSPLTARERLRAARVLSKYNTVSKPSKPDLGNKVLDALRASDGGKARSGLPQAPTNLFDDRKRGLPKQGWTFNFPGGNDLLLIIFSFVFISTVMFTTTYIVWKSGAIHFNEY
ncbi:hypothetical protein ACLOJK_026113 [Asimina triloba]